jgi:competence ComEA-like helix-hairpin-helix protein
MMLSGSKRKNRFMTISEGQIKGLIAVCLTLAIIPFFNLFYSLFISYKAPAFTGQLDNSLAIEVVENDQPKGIYFVGPETTSGQLLKTAGIGEFLYPAFKLNDGMKITINSVSGKNDIVVTKIASAERLALGMPLNINQVTEDELLLITGIGQATAEKILDLRSKLGRFRNIEQLMEIKGIKEKKLAEIRKYLYVEKRQK